MSTSVAEPVAVRVWFDSAHLFVALADGREVAVPLRGFPRLAHATAEQRMLVEMSGSGLHWPELDEDISVPGLVAGLTDSTRLAQQHIAGCPDCAATRADVRQRVRHLVPTGRRSKLRSVNVFDIEGIGPKDAEALTNAGVLTVEALLKTAGSAAGRKALAEKTRLDAGKLLAWVNRADLTRIKGVGSEFSDLLENAGVDTVKELATRRPDNLHAKLLEVNTAKKLVRRAPTATEVAAWVAEAKTLPRAVTR